MRHLLIICLIFGNALLARAQQSAYREEIITKQITSHKQITSQANSRKEGGKSPQARFSKGYRPIFVLLPKITLGNYEGHPLLCLVA